MWWFFLLEEVELRAVIVAILEGEFCWRLVDGVGLEELWRFVLVEEVAAVELRALVVAILKGALCWLEEAWRLFLLEETVAMGLGARGV